MSVKNDEKIYKPLFYNDINNQEIKNINKDYSSQNKTFFYVKNQNINENNSNLINENNKE